MGRIRIFYCFFVALLLFQLNIETRSLLRSDQKEIPHLIAFSENDRENTDSHCHLKSWHIEENSIFHKFDREYFMDHLLPEDDIPYRYEPSKKVSGKLIGDLIENLVAEIRAHKTDYTDFKVLKKRDFNRKQGAGLLIAKFKNYPFVLKLFLEIPQSFVKPFSKGWQSGCFFIMGGGISRYLSGFTRLRNREIIEQQIANDPYWHNKISLPRKWAWLPKNPTWFILQGFNLGPNYTIPKQMAFPCIYGIVADLITGTPLSLWNKEDRAIGINTAKFFTTRVDANIDNLVREPLTAYTHEEAPKTTQDTEDLTLRVNIPKEPQLVLIDTEHFPTFIGLKKPLEFESYTEWYLKLTFKFLKDCFFRTKEERYAAAREKPFNLIPL